MRQKLARLAVIVAAFLMINQFRLVIHAAQAGCECVGDIQTIAELTPPPDSPVCADHGFDYVNDTTDDPSYCEDWCRSQIEPAGVGYCGTDRSPCLPRAETNYRYSGTVYIDGYTFSPISGGASCPCC